MSLRAPPYKTPLCMIKIVSNNKERQMHISMFSEVGVFQSTIFKKRHRQCHWGGASCDKSSDAPSSQCPSITSDSTHAGKLHFHTSDHHWTCLGFRAKEAALSGPPKPTFQLRSSKGWYRRLNSPANPYRKHKLSWWGLLFGMEVSCIPEPERVESLPYRSSKKKKKKTKNPFSFLSNSQEERYFMGLLCPERAKVASCTDVVWWDELWCGFNLYFELLKDDD